jgi:ABC-type lipoprotein release transport system permease subunit
MSNDMILMDISLARKILGLKKDDFTDIVLEVENGAEMQKIEEKLIMSHFNTRIIKKSDIEKFYTNLFNYKGGVFLSLFFISLSAFLIILYQRYSVVTKMESKEIALLRMLGWKIKNIIYLKVTENFILATLAYMLGVIAAYIYVFILNAPLLKDIFLGYSNLETQVSFSFYPDIELLGLLYILFIVPFILTVIIPLYKIAITDISEVVR